MAGGSVPNEHPLICRLIAKNWWLPYKKTASKPGVSLWFMYPTGKASVPYDDYDLFIKEYALFLLTARDPCVSVVEAHGPVFKLFMDVDMKLPEPQAKAIMEDKAALERLLRCIYGAVAEGIQRDGAEMIVCTAKPYELGNGLWKAGLHLHWPEVVVNTKGAAALCKDFCVPACQAEFPGFTDWAAAFDESVFGDKKGLRLIASTKGGPGSKGTYYEPAFTMVGTALQQVEHPFLKLIYWLQKTSIHCEPEAGNEGPAEYTVSAGGGQAVGLQEHQEMLEAVRACITHPDFKAVVFTNLKVFQPDPAATTHPGRPKKKGQHACKNAEADAEQQLPVLSICLKSKRCLNLVGRTCHGSNHVYLVVKSSGIYQRCYNSHPTIEGRRWRVPCSELRDIARIGSPDDRLKKFMAGLLEAGC